MQASYDDPISHLPHARLHLARLAEVGEAQALQVLRAWLDFPFASAVTLLLKLGCADLAMAIQ